MLAHRPLQTLRRTRRLTTDASFLARRPANHVALTPLHFLARTADVFPSRTAIVYDDWRSLGASGRPPALVQTWGETAERVSRLASGLTARFGVGRGDVVAVLAPNTPAFVEALHGVNAAGAAINPINTRIDAETLAYILEHCSAKVLLADTAYAALTRDALARLAPATRPRVVDLADPVWSSAYVREADRLLAASGLAECDYEELLLSGATEGAALGAEWTARWKLPLDEWETQAINYTSGTTGKPKGVLYHHRGASLNALNNAVTWGLQQHPTFLWTLPLFHCNGWCFPYTITLQAGTHVCLRSVDPPAVFAAIASQRVSHLCGAPVVANMLLNAPGAEAVRQAGGVGVYCGGAANVTTAAGATTAGTTATATGVSEAGRGKIATDGGDTAGASGAHRSDDTAGAPVVHRTGDTAGTSGPYGAGDTARVPGASGVRVKMLCAGAPPPAAVLEAMEQLGFEMTHVYGLTESYGPAVGCTWQDEWALLPPEQRAELQARQGVRYPMLEGLRVVRIPEGEEGEAEWGGAGAAAMGGAIASATHSTAAVAPATGVVPSAAITAATHTAATLAAAAAASMPTASSASSATAAAGGGGDGAASTPDLAPDDAMPASWTRVARDGVSVGEVVMRGNVVMKGYLKVRFLTY